MLLSRAAAADARSPAPVSSGVTLPLRFLRKSIASVAGVLIRPMADLTPKEQISVRIICIYRARIRQPNWEHQT